MLAELAAFFSGSMRRYQEQIKNVLRTNQIPMYEICRGLLPPHTHTNTRSNQKTELDGERGFNFQGLKGAVIIVALS